MKALGSCLPMFDRDMLINHIIANGNFKGERSRLTQKFAFDGFSLFKDDTAQAFKDILQKLAPKGLPQEYDYDKIFTRTIPVGSDVIQRDKNKGLTVVKYEPKKPPGSAFTEKQLELINAQEKQTIVMTDLFNELLTVEREQLRLLNDIRKQQQNVLAGLMRLYECWNGDKTSTDIKPNE